MAQPAALVAAPPQIAPRATPPTVRRGGSSTSRIAAQPPRPVPTATFGNGRSPGVPTARPAEVPAPVLQAPLLPDSPPPAAPSPEPAPPRVVLTESPPPPETPVTAFAGTLVGVPRTGWPAGVLFGIAGLILAPIGGVWLGHRQARAVKSASQLVSR